MEMHPRFDQYDAIFGDDPQAYQEFLEALEATLTKSKRNLLQAAAAQDWNVISATRHSLKPTMTLLGAEPVNDLLQTNNTTPPWLYSQQAMRAPYCPGP